MMIELESREFHRALPLLAGVGQKVLPHAICEGITPGRVFVDRRDQPQVALLWSPVGYYCLGGAPASGEALAAIRRTLTDIFVPASQAGGESGFILLTSTPGWKDCLAELLPGREVIEIYRRPHAFDAARFAAQGDWRANIPPGFRLQAVDAAQAEALGVLASWASMEDFLAHGLGFALLDGETIASACTSVFASRARVEIDVHTAEPYRRRGFATLTAAALIEACLQRGLQPNWECFWDNEPSTLLASRLGFTAQPDYPVYFWEEAQG